MLLIFQGEFGLALPYALQHFTMGVRQVHLTLREAIEVVFDQVEQPRKRRLHRLEVVRGHRCPEQCLGLVICHGLEGVVWTYSVMR